MNDFQYELFNIINSKRHDFMNLFGLVPRYLLDPGYFTPNLYLSMYFGYDVEPKFMGMKVIEPPAGFCWSMCRMK